MSLDKRFWGLEYNYSIQFYSNKFNSKCNFVVDNNKISFRRLILILVSILIFEAISGLQASGTDCHQYMYA